MRGVNSCFLVVMSIAIIWVIGFVGLSMVLPQLPFNWRFGLSGLVALAATALIVSE